MADIIIKILEPADTFDLLSLDELKHMLGISDTDATQDQTLQELITRYSDVISTLCNRVFAKEKVRETWRCLGSRRVFLSHWPAAESDIESVECPRGTVMDPSTYEFEEKSGKLELFASRSEPIVVTYTGGYDLPDEAPPALKQACELLVREEQAYVRAIGMSGIRSLTHKESRVQFYDTAATGANASKGGMSVILSPTANALLMHYVRLQV